MGIGDSRVEMPNAEKSSTNIEICDLTPKTVTMRL